MGFDNMPDLEYDPLGVADYNKERDSKIEKIKSKLNLLQNGEMDEILSIIAKFEAQSK
ncbi:hypothetical protein HYW73_02385 [Candidatus Nomurabacteria bacterium]|nr:hypothetical protein [Candidatus Nomurabacteria bacterium]